MWERFFREVSGITPRGNGLWNILVRITACGNGLSRVPIRITPRGNGLWNILVRITACGNGFSAFL